MGYWFYKYEVEDRDIGVVDYAPLEDTEEIKFPDVSLCIEQPFHVKNLKATNTNVTWFKYKDHLAGEQCRYKRKDCNTKMYEKIDYANVTLDLNQYFTEVYVSWQNGTRKRIHSDSISYIETFNGFFDNYVFLKCFTMKLNVGEQRTVKRVSVSFDKMRMKSDRAWLFQHRLYLFVHYPSQFFLLKRIEIREVLLDRVHQSTISLEKLEILKQRNSRHRKCSKDIDNYDKSVVDEVLRRAGCHPPYLSPHQAYPKCKTQEDIKKGRIDLRTRKRIGIPKACQRISEVRQNVI